MLLPYFTRTRIDHPTIAERIDFGDCWTWTGATNGTYPTLYHDGKTRLAHRAIYADLTGAELEGLDLDHRCRNKLCVNPDHLDPVTHLTNTRRDHRRGRCKRGHIMGLPGGEGRLPSGGCRECNREAQRRWRRGGVG